MRGRGCLPGSSCRRRTEIAGSRPENGWIGKVRVLFGGERYASFFSAVYAAKPGVSGKPGYTGSVKIGNERGCGKKRSLRRTVSASLFSVICIAASFSSGAQTNTGKPDPDRIEALLQAWLEEERDRREERDTGTAGRMDPENGGDAGSLWEAEAERVLDRFRRLAFRPLAVNRASREELESLFFLSDFQIASLLDYRKQHGPLRSCAELAMLYGFDERTADRLRPFLRFDIPGGEAVEKDSGRDGTGRRGRRSSFFRRTDRLVRTELYWKTGRILHREEWYLPVSKEELEKHPGSRYLGSPWYNRLTYRGTCGERWQWGFTAEKDAGELWRPPGSKVPFGDFFSFHAAFGPAEFYPARAGRTGRLRVERLVIGDFSLRLGQGLTVWKGFSFSGTGSPEGLYKRTASPVLPSAATEENDYLRGIALSLTAGRWNMTAALSYHRRDASVEEERYTSLVSGGFHRTLSELERRKMLGEGLGAFSAEFRGNRFRLSMNGAMYGFDRKNGMRIREDNRERLYEGIWGDFSLCFCRVGRRWRWFGEAALDAAGHGAVLCGGTWLAGEGLSFGWSGRCYSRRYIAPHAGAVSSASGCFNQQGILFEASYSSAGNWRCGLTLESVHYPGPRYNVRADTRTFRGVLRAEYEDERWRAEFRVSERYSDENGSGRLRLRTIVKRKALSGWEWSIRAEGARAGISGGGRASFSGMAEAGGGYTSSGGVFRVYAACTWFDARAWENRLYGYERDLPGTFGSRLLYGCGVRGYCLAGFRIKRMVSFWLKADWEIKRPGGAGTSDVAGTSGEGVRSRWSSGLRWRF